MVATAPNTTTTKNTSRGVQRHDQLAEIDQHAEPLLADGGRHRAEDAQRREQHHVIGVSEHHFGKRFAEFDHRAGALAPMAAQAAPNMKENTTICSTSPRAIASMMLVGNDVLENLRQVRCRLRQRPAAAALVQLNAHARLHQIHGAQPDEQTRWW